MPHMDLEATRAFLEMLRDMGVTEWDSEAFTVRFGHIPSEPVISEVEGRGVPEPKTLFEHGNLWPSGQAPRFPTKER